MADVVTKLGTKPLLAPPGAVFNYSNVGYTFVAAVIERVTERPFEEVVKERVLVPAGIPDARFGSDQVNVKTPPLEGGLCRRTAEPCGLLEVSYSASES